MNGDASIHDAERLVVKERSVNVKVVLKVCFNLVLDDSIAVIKEAGWSWVDEFVDILSVLVPLWEGPSHVEDVAGADGIVLEDLDALGLFVPTLIGSEIGWVHSKVAFGPQVFTSFLMQENRAIDTTSCILRVESLTHGEHHLLLLVVLRLSEGGLEEKCAQECCFHCLY